MAKGELDPSTNVPVPKNAPRAAQDETPKRQPDAKVYAVCKRTSGADQWVLCGVGWSKVGDEELTITMVTEATPDCWLRAVPGYEYPQVRRFVLRVKGQD